jgi:hypothetical protein
VFAPVRFDLNESIAKRLITFGFFVLVALTPFITAVSLGVYLIALTFSIFIYKALAPFERFTGFIWNADKDKFYLFSKDKVLEASPPAQIIHLGFVIFIKAQPMDRALPVWIGVWFDQLPDRDWRRLSVISQYAPVGVSR